MNAVAMLAHCAGNGDDRMVEYRQDETDEYILSKLSLPILPEEEMGDVDAKWEELPLP